MLKPKSKKEILVKVHDDILENLIRNEIDVVYYKAEDKYVNTTEAKRQARDARDRAIENVRGTKRTLNILDELLEKED